MIKLSFIIFIPLLLLAQTEEENYMFKEGKAIYQQTCVACHGNDGKTNQSMQLLVKPRTLVKTILTQEQSFQIIKEGAHFWGARADIMPSFKSIYSDDDIRSVAFYISKAFNPNRDEKVNKLLEESKTKLLSEEKLLKDGHKIFKRNCSLCHGITGNGESAYVEQSKENDNLIYPYNLTRTLLTEEQVFLYAKYGGHFWGADKTDMPSWKKKYNDEKLKAVARYVHLKIKKIKE